MTRSIWVNQSFIKGGTSQCPPQVLSFPPILTEDFRYVMKTVLVIASSMPQMSPVTPLPLRQEVVVECPVGD